MTPEITQLLDQLRAGDRAAFNTLVSLLYDELHRIAGKHLHSERTSHTLQTTALVNEAYMKILESRQCNFNDRAHFLAVASRAMRQVLVDYARAKAFPKRSAESTKNQAPAGWMTNLELTDNSNITPSQLLDLNAALEALDQEDFFLARLIDMRYFGGMTAEETAEALGRSVHIVRQDLRLAQAWLRRRLRA
jgi:RNA polymerase sigma-70 factor (ECF subfamily)